MSESLLSDVSPHIRVPVTYICLIHYWKGAGLSGRVVAPTCKQSTRSPGVPSLHMTSGAGIPYLEDPVSWLFC